MARPPAPANAAEPPSTPAWAGALSCALQSVLGAAPLYVSASALVIVKPPGLLSVPGRGAAKLDCAAVRVRDALRRVGVHDLPGPVPAAEPGGPALPGIPHRLDMATSGALCFALTAHAMRALAGQFAARTVRKSYAALLTGDLRARGCPATGELTLHHRIDLDDRPRQCLDREHGKEAVTRYRLLGAEPCPRTGAPLTRVRFEPITGRTHQLRVAAAAPARAGGLDAPIAGDALYGTGLSRPAVPSGRLCLHATELRCTDPGPGEEPVPRDGGAPIAAASSAPF